MTTAADHADAYAMVAEEGAAVTFSTGTPGTHDPETRLFTSPTTATVTGVAIRVKADRQQEDAYRAAGLTVDRVDERLTDTHVGEAAVGLVQREPVVLDERA